MVVARKETIPVIPVREVQDGCSLETRFERLLEETLDQARDRLEDEDDDLSREDLSLDELEELASRWGVSTSDIDEISEQVDARQDSRQPRHVDGQQSLMVPDGTTAQTPAKSIFNYL
jgi:hypothetical protein